MAILQLLVRRGSQQDQVSSHASTPQPSIFAEARHFYIVTDGDSEPGEPGPAPCPEVLKCPTSPANGATRHAQSGLGRRMYEIAVKQMLAAKTTTPATAKGMLPLTDPSTRAKMPTKPTNPDSAFQRIVRRGGLAGS